jgi:hypothetical protein
VQSGMPRPSGKGHCLCQRATLPRGGPGAKARGQRPPRPRVHPRRALAAVGAGGDGFGGSLLRGRGKRGVFPFPTRSEAEGQTPNHQRRCHGRGHRPCHVGTVTLGEPGAQSPRPAPAPPVQTGDIAHRRARTSWTAILRWRSVLGVWGNAVRFGVRPDWRSLTPKHMGFRFGSAACRKSACPHHKREMIRTAASTHPARSVPAPPHLAEEMRLQMLNSH